MSFLESCSSSCDWHFSYACVVLLELKNWCMVGTVSRALSLFLSLSQFVFHFLPSVSPLHSLYFLLLLLPPSSLAYFHALLCGISRCPVWNLKSTPAAKPGRAVVIPQQGHTAVWDWRAVQPDAFCFTALSVCVFERVCLSFVGWKDGRIEQKDEGEKEKESEARGTSFAFVEFT